MRKSFFIWVLLTGLAFGIFIVGTGYVNQGKEQVEITEQILYGSLTEAEGISFRMQTHWNTKLLWNTEYQIGNPAQTKSEFQFCQRGKEISFKVTEAGITLTVNLPNQFVITGADLSYSNESEFPWMVLFKEIANRTDAGESHTEEIYLSDYYCYYPLRLDVESSKISSMLVPEYAQEMVNQYIQIPVLPDDKAEISIRKNKNGEIEEMWYRSLEGGILIQTSGIVLDIGCYFSFACYDREEQLLDMEFLNTEYGIYFLPYHWESGERLYGEDYAVIEYDKIECIYALEAEDGSVLALQEDGDRFLMITKEADTLVLIVIKKDTKEILQRVEVFAYEEADRFQSLEQGEEGILLTMRSGRLCFLTKDERGDYQKQVYGDLNRIEEIWEREHLILDHVFQWDGERLVVAGFLYWSNSVYLAVFKEEGMVFLGYYQHSGDLDRILGLGGISAPIQPMGKLHLQITL